jgi:hypothetical protein
MDSEMRPDVRFYIPVPPSFSPHYHYDQPSDRDE